MKSDDIFPDVSELDRAAGRVSLRKVLPPEPPSVLDRVCPRGWLWLGAAAAGWGVVGLAVWGVAALAGWLWWLG